MKAGVWPLLSAERRLGSPSTTSVSGMGCKCQAWDLSWQGSHGDVCRVLGTRSDAAPRTNGAGVPRVPRLWGTTLHTPDEG